MICPRRAVGVVLCRWRGVLSGLSQKRGLLRLGLRRGGTCRSMLGQ
jgi:hypothetical protein